MGIEKERWWSLSDCYSKCPLACFKQVCSQHANVRMSALAFGRLIFQKLNMKIVLFTNKSFSDKASVAVAGTCMPHCNVWAYAIFCGFVDVQCLQKMCHTLVHYHVFVWI
jgi:hypothetical protein